MSDRKSDSQTRVLPRIWAIGCITALSFAGLDLIRGMQGNPLGYSVFSYIMIPFAASTVVTFMGWFVLYLILTLLWRRHIVSAKDNHLVKRRRHTAHALHAGCAVFCAGVVSSWMGWLDPSAILREPFSLGLKLMGVGCAAFLLTAPCRLCTRVVLPLRTGLWIVLWFILAVFGTTWLVKYGTYSVDTLLFSVLVLGLFILMGIVVCITGQKLPWIMDVTSAMLLCTCFVIAGSTIMCTYHDENAMPVLPHKEAYEDAPKQVLLITIDALRLDVVTPYNPHEGLTPELSRFASDGLIFHRAWSTSPWTLPALTSMHTGLFAEVHGVNNTETVVPNVLRTVAEQLEETGIHTAAVVNNYFTGPVFGLDQGFSFYRYYPRPERIETRSLGGALARRFFWRPLSDRGDATDITDWAIRWLANHENSSFFLWLHYFDPHTPYAPPDAFVPESAEVSKYGKDFTSKIEVLNGRFGNTAEERDWIRSLYDGEVMYTDNEVGRLLHWLRNRGLYEDMLIIVTADHGEEFWDHNGFEHGHTVYNELIHMPFIMKFPGNMHAGTTDMLVSTAAIAPTLLEYFDVDVIIEDMSVDSLSPFSGSEQTQEFELPVTSGSLHTGEDRFAVLFDHFKYICFTESGQEELYDLLDDPAETNNLVDLAPPTLEVGRKHMQDALDAAIVLRERLGIQTDSYTIDELPEDIEAGLRALGYL